ncbi:MAG: hypothetical protein AAGC60_03495 [Acidobacteriota bacterium]
MTTDRRFATALQTAIERSVNDETSELTLEQREAMGKGLLEFYAENPEPMERAAQALATLVKEKRSEAFAEQVDGALRTNRGIDASRVRSALHGGDLQPVAESVAAEGITALSIGLALPQLDLVVPGGTVGIDALWVPSTNQVFGRGYAQASVGLDASIGIGLSLGLWKEVPTLDRVSYTGGWFIDVDLIFYGVPYVFLRVTALGVGDKFLTKPGDLTFVGAMLTINGGFGLGFELYRGIEVLIGLPSLRSSLTVTNCTDGTDPCSPGTSSIAQDVESTMVCKLENTSGKTIEIAPGDEMNLWVPRYFTDDDAAGITVDPPSSDWEVGEWDQRKMVMTYNGSDTLDWTGTLKTTLSTATASQDSPTKGYFKTTIPNAVVDGGTLEKTGVAATAKVELVPSILYATISTWNIEVPDFTVPENEPTSGSDVSINTQSSSSTVVELTEVQDSDDNTWILGYQFYIDDTTGNPYFRACWSKQGAIQIYGKTLYGPNWSDLSQGEATSVATYGNVTNGSDYITITVSLDDSADD